MSSKSKSKKSPSTQSGSTKERKNAKFKEAKNKDEGKDTLAFKVLSSTQTKELLEIGTVEEVQVKLAEIMKLTQYPVDLKEAGMLDYYTSGFWWSKEQSYTPEQVSAFFTVIHTLLENIKEKHLGVVDNLKEYKKLLVGIGMENHETSGGLDCFDVLQAKAITDYLYMSLFQHYKLYEYMFSHTQAEEIIGTDLDVETALPASMPWPPPLEEAVSEDNHANYIATPPATPEQQEGSAEVVNGESAEGGASEEEANAADTQKEADILAQLTPEQVTDIMNSVFDEMLSGLKNDVSNKLRDKENAFIQRINKIHKVQKD